VSTTESPELRHAALIEVVRESARQTIVTMLNLEVVNGPVYSEQRHTVPSSGIIAMVGLAGAVDGNGCLFMGKRLACLFASKLLMADYEEVNDEVMDAAAELCNMIIGGLKTALEEEKGPMGLSVPTVVFADNYLRRNANLGERFVIEFESGEGDYSDKFFVQVCLITEPQNRNYLRQLADFHARLV
jgi:chemotaxis protein CheX